MDPIKQFKIPFANIPADRLNPIHLLTSDYCFNRRGCASYLIMYNRFHNYVAEHLLNINENGKFSLPFDEDSKQWKDSSEELKIAMKKKQDEDLIQTARLQVFSLDNR